MKRSYNSRKIVPKVKPKTYFTKIPKLEPVCLQNVLSKHFDSLVCEIIYVFLDYEIMICQICFHEHLFCICPKKSFMMSSRLRQSKKSTDEYFCDNLSPLTNFKYTPVKTRTAR